MTSIPPCGGRGEGEERNSAENNLTTRSLIMPRDKVSLHKVLGGPIR